MKRNTAGLRGGGIYNFKGNVTLTESSFVNQTSRQLRALVVSATRRGD